MNLKYKEGRCLQGEVGREHWPPVAKHREEGETAMQVDKGSPANALKNY